MKNKILLLSLLITAPAAIFAAAPLDAVVVGHQQRHVDVLRELQNVQAEGVEVAARQGLATLAPYANYAGKIVQWSFTGVGAMALFLWRFGETVTDRQITLPAILLGGGVGVGFGIWRSEEKRKSLNRQAAQERARVQNEANALAALTVAAHRVVTEEQRAVEARAQAAKAEELREEARRDLAAANRRLEAESQRHHEAEQASRASIDRLAGQVGTNNQGLMAVVRGQLLQIRLQRGPALVAAGMLRQNGQQAEADEQQQALNDAERVQGQLTSLEQQLALPAPAAMAALPATDTNS